MSSKRPSRSAAAAASSGPSSSKRGTRSSNKAGYDVPTYVLAGSEFDSKSGIFIYRGSWFVIDDDTKKLIKTIIIEEGVTMIPGKKNGAGQFDTINHLTSITLPRSLVDIGPFAFRNCPSLTSLIMLSDSMRLIGAWSLRDCVSLTTLKIPDSAYLGYGCLLGCRALEEAASKYDPDLPNLNAEQYCRLKWRNDKLFSFKVNLFASYKALDDRRANDPLLNDPLIDKTSIMWALYDKITSDDVRRNVMGYLGWTNLADSSGEV